MEMRYASVKTTNAEWNDENRIKSFRKTTLYERLHGVQ